MVRLLKKFMFIVLCYVSLMASAQPLTETVRTLQTIKNGDWMAQPVLQLDSDDYLTISFDEMSHRYHRYTYHLTHCSSDWKPSDLYESDWLDGFNDRPIEDYQNSLNTTFEYTHYSFEIPNSNVRLKYSGNYTIDIIDDATGQKVATTQFSVIEPLTMVSAEVSGNTDIDTNGENQQVSFSVNYSGLRVREPERELLVTVTQNRRNDFTVSGLKPTHLTGNSLQFTNNRNLIFAGGNEFRHFEIINMYDNVQGVDHIDFFDPYFHANLFQDSRIRVYQYDQDHNGRFLIRHSHTDASETEADYLFVHFSLKTPQIPGGEVYLNGDFSYQKYSDDFKLDYNHSSGAYEGTVLLKEGAYDYRYLWKPDGSMPAQTAQFEGNSFETENEYLILVYYRERGARYDRLVGMCDLRMAGE
ncbi:MAG: DUF5103 domain-containing protein [Bacteroidaceae bacterium]|nr:DUF5103 domain-containing protein [Bacteroidaceae bacterium]